MIPKSEKAVRPSIVEIFEAVEGAIGRAEGFVQVHPEHGDAVGRFITDLHQIGLELRTACRMDTKREASNQVHSKAILHDIVLFLTIGRSYADIISERQPDYAAPLKRFQTEVSRVQEVLIKKVYSS